MRDSRVQVTITSIVERSVNEARKGFRRHRRRGSENGFSRLVRVSSCAVIFDPLYFCRRSLQRPRISRAFVDKLISCESGGKWRSRVEDSEKRHRGPSIKIKGLASRQRPPSLGSFLILLRRLAGPMPSRAPTA